MHGRKNIKLLILILSSHPRLCLQSRLFPSGFNTKPPPISIIFLGDLNLLLLTDLIILVQYKSSSSLFTIFGSILHIFFMH